MPIKDPEARRRYHREWMRRRREEWFSGKSCAYCGSTERLELDHIDPAQKVSHRIWSWSAERREAELAKCQPLCKECHAVKSRGAIPGTGHSAAGYNRGCRCGTCRQAKRDRMRRYRAK